MLIIYQENTITNWRGGHDEDIVNIHYVDHPVSHLSSGMLLVGFHAALLARLLFRVLHEVAEHFGTVLIVPEQRFA